LAIHRSDGIHITGPNTQFAEYEIPSIEGEGVVQYTVSSLPLLEGTYYVSVAARDWDDTTIYDYHDRLYPFRVFASNERYGMIALGGVWQCKE
jgi:lipopolysaccharide transport system ATP-binding protein